MIKEVTYSGHTAQSSDYRSPDGDLAIAINAIPEDGSIRPILPPGTEIELGQGNNVAYIHKDNYIIQNQKQFSWRKKDGSGASSPLHNIGSATFYQATSIGNTLLLLTSEGTYHFLWKDGTYLSLGTHIPECQLSFGLHAEMKRTDPFTVDLGVVLGNKYQEFSDSLKEKITNQVLAQVNKFIKEQSTDKGKFIYPFLLRYAYRLYDGSLTMHSSPILMIASSDITPQVFVGNFLNNDQSVSLRVAAAFHTIDYNVFSDESLQELKQWSDIVKSIDVFVSKPIYTYDQNGKCTSFAKVEKDNGNFSVCLHTNQAASTETYPLRYQRNTFRKLYAFTFNPDTLEEPEDMLILPAKSKDEVKAEIKACSNFYLLSSINIMDLSVQAERQLLHVDENYLQSLVTREVMTDDYDSHDTLVAQYAFPYNSRLNIANLKKVLFTGHNAACLFPYSNGYVNNYSSGEPPTDKDDTLSTRVYVYIKQDGKDIVVEGGVASFGFKAPFLFFYYPNTNAYKALVKQNGKDPYVMKLEKHDFLNGAFYFGGWENPPQSQDEWVPDNPNANVDKRTISLDNKIYTSEVNNPFHFPVLGINTVGTGTILGISAAVRALSEGQFGQFPLYAFTTEGVWALEVSSTGTYIARQPITRDVCNNPQSITQTDTAVLFSADRGIMLLSGSQSVCISDAIDPGYKEDTFSIGSLPNGEELLRLAGNIQASSAKIISLKDFLEGCQMLYDYPHQRVIIFNPQKTYAYVYSLQSKKWGMMESSLSSAINAYPEALAMGKFGNVLNFSSLCDEGIAVLLVTRPMKLDMPDILKTIDTIIQRGHFRKGHVKTVLYGSRDLYRWHLVWSSKDHYLRGFRGTPYKYFRIACIATMFPEESISGASIQFTPRLTNQPR